MLNIKYVKLFKRIMQKLPFKITQKLQKQEKKKPINSEAKSDT